MNNWIDLSLPIHSQMPVYPGDPPTRLIRRADHEHDQVQITELMMSCHAGTHLDAPRHFVDGGSTVEQLSLDRLITTAWVAAAPVQTNGLIDLTVLDLSGRQPHDALLLFTGWDIKADHSAYYQSIPQFTKGSTDLLLSWHIQLLGLDMPTVIEDNPGADPAPMHRRLLGDGMILVESLVGLAPLVGRRIQFAALPLALHQADGSPVRACARVL